MKRLVFCLKPKPYLLDFLQTALAQQLCSWIASDVVAGKSSQKYAWLEALVNDSGRSLTDISEVKRLENATHSWSVSLQNYLVHQDNQQLATNQFQVCFSLIPPQNLESGEENWRLAYALQALEDEEIWVDAETVWQHPVEVITVNDHAIEQPQEVLLKGLGLASNIYAPIADSLQEPAPKDCELNPIQVYEFIRVIAWQLEDHGLGVILPGNLASGTSHNRLGVSVKASVKRKKGERLGLKSLLSYDLSLSMGDRQISAQDFEKLLAQKSPLVQLEGEWIVLQPADVRAAQEILKKSHEPVSLTVEDALRLSTGESQGIGKLPVTQFETSGILKELIDNLTNNRKIEPIISPQGFSGQLRPYQARGVGWLAFLEQWGLGACLADDMGLGKTPQLIALLLHLKAEDLLEKPSLVICPTSILSNWQREVHKFAPALSVLVHHGSQRAQGNTFAQKAKKQNLVITSYALGLPRPKNPGHGELAKCHFR